MRMIREWRYLKSLKRAGGQQQSNGADDRELGSCAVVCPACPQPGRNLPDGWEAAPKEKGYVYFVLYNGMIAHEL